MCCDRWRVREAKFISKIIAKKVNGPLKIYFSSSLLTVDGKNLEKPIEVAFALTKRRQDATCHKD
jgi:hypothetical protein